MWVVPAAAAVLLLSTECAALLALLVSVRAHGAAVSPASVLAVFVLPYVLLWRRQCVWSNAALAAQLLAGVGAVCAAFVIGCGDASGLVAFAVLESVMPAVARVVAAPARGSRSLRRMTLAAVALACVLVTLLRASLSSHAAAASDGSGSSSSSSSGGGGAGGVSLLVLLAGVLFAGALAGVPSALFDAAQAGLPLALCSAAVLVLWSMASGSVDGLQQQQHVSLIEAGAETLMLPWLGVALAVVLVRRLDMAQPHRVLPLRLSLHVDELACLVLLAPGVLAAALSPVDAVLVFGACVVRLLHALWRVDEDDAELEASELGDDADSDDSSAEGGDDVAAGDEDDGAPLRRSAAGDRVTHRSTARTRARVR